MEMLKSEVKLLLLRNSQLESENLLLKQNQLKLNQNLFNEKQLNKVLESIKLAQNEYISKLNLLLADLTQENGNQLNYLQIRTDINQCVKICKQLQNEYELSKQSLISFNQKFLTQNNQSFDSTQDSQTSIGDQSVEDSDNELVFDEQDMEEEEEEEEQEMPELDLIGDQSDEIMRPNNTDDDEDEDPNGAGEQYLDINDTEFIPKRPLPKSARKSITINEISPKRKRSKDKGFKTSQKFGDKFRCNWKGCVFISSYKQNVERHYRVHTGERPFKCQYKGCAFSASQAGNLKVHQQRHGHHTPNAHKIRVKSTHNAVKASPNAKSLK